MVDGAMNDGPWLKSSAELKVVKADTHIGVENDGFTEHYLDQDSFLMPPFDAQMMSASLNNDTNKVNLVSVDELVPAIKTRLRLQISGLSVPEAILWRESSVSHKSCHL